MDKICYYSSGRGVWLSLTMSTIRQQVTCLKPVSNSQRKALIKTTFANQTLSLFITRYNPPPPPTWTHSGWIDLLRRGKESQLISRGLRWINTSSRIGPWTFIQPPSHHFSFPSCCVDKCKACWHAWLTKYIWVVDFFFYWLTWLQGI